MTLIGVRLMARYAGGRPIQRGDATEWEIVEDLGGSVYALETRPASDRPAVRIERTLEQLRERCWQRLR